MLQTNTHMESSQYLYITYIYIYMYKCLYIYMHYMHTLFPVIKRSHVCAKLSSDFFHLLQLQFRLPVSSLRACVCACYCRSWCCLLCFSLTTFRLTKFQLTLSCAPRRLSKFYLLWRGMWRWGIERNNTKAILHKEK